ncbi:MAG: PAS domain S-box protein [Desulfobacterota bacterium]|nr:PAS domain S-box protein [Thermodesulfobacteriota bacterium]
MVAENTNRPQPLESSDPPHINQQIADELERLKGEQQQLHASIRRLMLAMEATADGIWDFNFPTNQAYFSPNYAAMLGYSPSELIPQIDTIERLIHPDDLPTYREQLTRHLGNSAVDFRCQYRMKTKQGTWQWVLSRGKVVEKDKYGTPIRMVGTHTDISYIKKIETSLKESQERFQAVVALCPDPIIIVDAKGSVLYWNDAAQQITGYVPEEIIGESFKKLMPSWIKSHILQDGIPKRHREHFQSVLITKNGQEIPVEVSVATWTIGGEYFYSALIRDLCVRNNLREEQIILRHRLEQQLREQTLELQKAHDFLENIFQTAGDAIVVTDPKGIILMVNHKTEQLFGYAAQEMVGQHCRMLNTSDQKGIDIHRSDLLYKTGFVDNLRMACCKKNGDVFIAESNIALIRSASGAVIGAVASLRDITEKTKAETALEHSRKRYYDLFNELTDAAFVADVDTGILLDVNRAAEHLMGCSRTELIGDHFTNLHPPERKPFYQDLFNQCGTQHTTRNIDCEVLTRTNTVIPVTINTTVFEQDGKRIMIGLFRDVSEQKRVEQQLRLAYFILNNASEAIICVDKDARIVFANQASSQLLGLTPETIQLQPIYEISKWSVHKSWQEYWEENKKKKQVIFDAPFESPDGLTRHLLFLHNFFEFKDEEYICAFIRNITDIKKVQENLAREIEERKEVERQLHLREQELAAKANELTEVNNALKILLQRTEESKKEIEEKILYNMQELVAPYIEKLKEILNNDRQKTYLNIIASNVMNIVSPFGKNLSVKSAKLTPTEIHIANLIKNGCSTKKIADMMGLSNRTVDFHRNNIRKKLGVNDRKTSLRSVLLSFD